MRKCFNCDNPIPPETEHFVIEYEPYCTDCIEVTPYTAFMYFLDGEYMGDSEHDEKVEHIQSYDDEYELEADTP